MWVDTPRFCSNTRPSGRRFPWDSWEEGRGRPPCCRCDNNVQHSLSLVRLSECQTVGPWRMSESPTVSQQMTRHQTSW